jgi:hypothetical protein
MNNIHSRVFFKFILEASIQFIQAVKLYDSNSSLLITVLNSLLIDYQDTSLAIELLKFVNIFRILKSMFFF